MSQSSALKNIQWHETSISKKDRSRVNGHKSCVVWFTGLSGSGKSTLADGVHQKLFEMKSNSYILDGDNIRHGLNKDLGFSPEDRQENIRRIGEVSKLFVDNGTIVLTAFVSPYKADRDMARRLVDADEFIEIYVKCTLQECENRDPKGLYKKARAGEIPEFTGISAPYEEPENPELTISTDELSIENAVEEITDYLRKRLFSFYR
ncbi:MULTISPECIES: adenylyl-sulfate kinase [Alteribacter]|uniref:Adenylyl-sulfate kinase n=1 Tax=Alteribacter keqinensis TaxID=2483800 RepID=A0A3M7TQC0_9BACI|nr:MULTISPECIES: adenylyl-sulfate kinase [Alteribacter]MBM7096964.1 adenylyl-sulfate kinase [Alteribacter salitolerans]RNA67457.1 adenylyl-sulfate kinase [Alteribacter keqinensis]